jgi:hypothetical protein
LTAVTSRKRNPGQTRCDGCGFLVLTCVFTCFFLILNCALVSRFYGPLSSYAPPVLQHPRVTQAIMYVAPVALMLIEWWVVDLVVDLVSFPRRPPPAGHEDRHRRR